MFTSYDQYAEYTGAKPYAEQAGILKEVFPELKTYSEKLCDEPILPGSEGKFLIPDWRKISPQYGAAVCKVIQKLAERRQVENYRECQFSPKYIQQKPHSHVMWGELNIWQTKFDIYVLDAQFGLRHREKSIHDVRVYRPEVHETVTEYLLGAYAGLIMLLTHPERERSFEQVHPDFGGDEYAPYGDGVFTMATSSCFYESKLQFYASVIDQPRKSYGCISGFLKA